MGKLNDSLAKLGVSGYSRYEPGETFLKQVEAYDAKQQRHALLNILFLAGYFAEQQVWEDIHLIGDFSDPETTYKLMHRVLEKAGAFQDDLSQFHPQILLDELFAEDDFDDEDALDFVTYWRQTAFDRPKLTSERCDLEAKTWMQAHEKAFLENARVLGVLDEHKPCHKHYDEAWVHGASRLRVTSRMETLQSMLNRNITVDRIRVLAGNRELWAEIDGIGDDTAAKVTEGKRYLLELAAKHDLKLASEPLICYQKGDEIPAGRAVGRTYLNYAPGETRRATESMMAQDVYQKLIGRPLETNELIDTQALIGERPTTVTTANDAAIRCVADTATDKEVLRIASISNQPYIERQAFTTHLAIEKAMQQHCRDKSPSLDVEGIGDRCEVGIAAINSELGSMSGEQYKAATAGETRRRDASQLMFRPRNQDRSSIRPRIAINQAAHPELDSNAKSNRLR